MLKTKHLLFIFIPAILIAGFVFFIRLVEYQPLYPKISSTSSTVGTVVPIFVDDPITGSANAGVSIVVFEDFGCSHCKTTNALLNQVWQKYPDKIKIVWKGLPVTKFPVATDLAHEYAYCANQQEKYTDFSEIAFANSTNLNADTLSKIATQINLNQNQLKKCLESNAPADYLNRIYNLATSLNIQVVPTIFLNDQQIQTPQLIEEWETLINKALLISNS